MSDWIPSQVGLRNHPKTRRLARALGVPVPHVIGHLHCLWYWALEYAPDGDLEDFDSEDLADAAGWEGDPGQFIEALLECGSKGRPGFLSRVSGRLTIHDWEDNQGDGYRARIQAAAKKRAQRAAKQGQGSDADPSDEDAVPESRDVVPESGDTVPTSRDLARAKDKTDKTDKTEKTDRQEPTGASAPLETDRPTAQTMVAFAVDYCQEHGYDLADDVKGHLAREIGKQFSAGRDPVLIRDGVAELLELNKSPQRLSWVMGDIQRRRNGGGAGAHSRDRLGTASGRAEDGEW